MKTQDMILYALVILAIWLMFFRKTEGFCGACAMGLAA
jgi:hypothetical protein